MTTEEQIKLREERRIKLCALMKDNKIKGTTLTAYCHIGSGEISMLTSGKQPISDKRWNLLSKAIEDILDGKGVPADPKAPVPKVETEKILIPPYMLLPLQNFENTLIHKKEIEGKEQLFLDQLKEVGLVCKLINNGNCWIVHRPVIIKDLPEANDHWDVEAIAKVSLDGPITVFKEVEDVLQMPEPIEVEDIPQMPEPKVIKENEASLEFSDAGLIIKRNQAKQPSTIDYQIEYIERLIERNSSILDNIDLLGYSATITRIKNDQPVLDQILESLKKVTNPSNTPFVDMCRPLVDWLATNYNPHTTIIITSSYAKVVMDEMKVLMGKLDIQMPTTDHRNITLNEEDNYCRFCGEEDPLPINKVESAGS